MMNNIPMTDVVVFLILCFFGFQGYRKGLLRTILGPVSMAAAFFLAWGYFNRTGNWMMSCAIGFLGPFVIQLIVSMILRLMRKADDEPSLFSSLSRVCGMLLSLSWGAGIIFIIIIVIAVTPLDYIGLKPLRTEVMQSTSYRLIAQVVRPHFPNLVPDTHSQKKFDVSREKLMAVENGAEYHEILNNPHMQELLADPEVLEQIKNKDFHSLINNPKILKIMQDDQLVKEFLKFNMKMVQPGNNPAVASP